MGNGGANESRTRDLLHAMQARYQLRYSPPIKTLRCFCRFARRQLVTGLFRFRLLKRLYEIFSKLASNKFSYKTAINFLFLEYHSLLKA
jgi:hypothetical protein